MIITWLSGLLLLIELNPSPPPSLLRPFLALTPLFISSHSRFPSRSLLSLCFFSFPWPFFAPVSLAYIFSSLSVSFSLSRHVSSFSLSPPPHMPAFFPPSSSFSFSTGFFSSFLPLLLFIYMLSHSLCPPHPPFLTLSLLEHCDTVVMVTPIIFWHEWRILY